MRRRPNTQTVQWFLEIDAQGQLDLEPPYQRRSVWNAAYRRFYIDTVLRDFPSPAIFLQIENRPGVPTIYHVIDGKQRLETLLQFSKGEFHLADFFEDKGLDDPYFEDLPENYRDAFGDYILGVENITRANESELKDAFDRLNRNVAKLNRQELRKAQYDGRFITKMTELAAAPTWEEIGIATRSRIQRMLDVEFVSEIYLLSMRGVSDGSPDILDDAYAGYDEAIPDEEKNDQTYYRILSYLDSLPIDWRTSRWKNLGDIYGLWAALTMLTQSQLPDPTIAARRLEAFELALREPTDSWALTYNDAVRQGSNKEASRGVRAAIIADHLIQPTLLDDIEP